MRLSCGKFRGINLQSDYNAVFIAIIIDGATKLPDYAALDELASHTSVSREMPQRS